MKDIAELKRSRSGRGGLGPSAWCSCKTRGSGQGPARGRPREGGNYEPRREASEDTGPGGPSTAGCRPQGRWEVTVLSSRPRGPRSFVLAAPASCAPHAHDAQPPRPRRVAPTRSRRWPSAPLAFRRGPSAAWRDGPTVRVAWCVWPSQSGTASQGFIFPDSYGFGAFECRRPVL